MIGLIVFALLLTLPALLVGLAILMTARSHREELWIFMGQYVAPVLDRIEAKVDTATNKVEEHASSGWQARCRRRPL